MVGNLPIQSIVLKFERLRVLKLGSIWCRVMAWCSRSRNIPKPSACWLSPDVSRWSGVLWKFQPKKKIHAWRGIHIGHKPWWMVELPMHPTVGLRLHDFNNDVKDKIGATSNTLHSEPRSFFACLVLAILSQLSNSDHRRFTIFYTQLKH